jgi:hypothetical protein
LGRVETDGYPTGDPIRRYVACTRATPASAVCDRGVAASDETDGDLTVTPTLTQTLD